MTVARRALVSLPIAALTLALGAACGSSSANKSAVGPDGGNGGSGAGSASGAGGAVTGTGAATGAGGKAPAGAFGITPKAATAGFGGKVTFRNAGPETNLEWTVDEGAAGGTITSAGVYTAPSTSGAYHVTLKSGSRSDTATVTITAPVGTPPVLTPGVWTNITPSQLNLTCCPGTGGNSFGISQMTVDPTNPDVLYFTVDLFGLWRSTDRGSSWTRMGDESRAGKIGDASTAFLDSPIEIRVDPSDSRHLYATGGVRGANQGFWVSRDGGETWNWPPGFVEAVKTVGTFDMTVTSVDPADFNHVLVGSHQPWRGLGNAGILETKDGGETFIVHQPRPTWNAGTIGINMLKSPHGNAGNAETWLVGNDSDGLWRTTDSGQNWTKVSEIGIGHGGQNVYYTKDGTLYAGATGYVIRSKDNGATWQQMQNGVPYAYYYTVGGDGKLLYAMLSGTGLSGREETPYVVSPETDGETWAPFKGGSQKFLNGPFEMTFDPVNGILYSANWVVGIWALKVE